MESWTSGPHLYEFEPPDIFHCHVRGPVEEKDARESVRITMEELKAKRGIRVYFLGLMEYAAKGNPFTIEARKFLGDAKPDWKAIIVVGGNPLVRAAANVVSRAQALLSGQKMTTKMVASVDEARGVIAELRAKEEAAAVSAAKSD